MAFINKLLTKFDRSAIDRDFDFFEISTSRKFFSFTTPCADIPMSELKARSVAFLSGRRIIAMFRKGEASPWKIIQSLHDDEVKVVQQSESSLPDFALLRLLLGSLSNYQGEELSFNNLTGRFYLIDPAWNKRGNKSIVALAIDIDEDLTVEGSATTFVRTKVPTKKTDIMPAYFAEAGNGKLVRVVDPKPGDYVYVKGGLKDRRAAIDFLTLKAGKIEHCRSYSIDMVLRMLNSRLREYVHVECGEARLLKTITERRDEDFASKAILCLHEEKLYAVNLIEDSYYDDLFESLVASIEQAAGKEVIRSKTLNPDGVNFAFLHEEEYYGKDDPYRNIDRRMIVQCATSENAGAKVGLGQKAVLNTVLKEAAIKADIYRHGHFSIDDWPSFGFQGDWYFGLENDGQKHFMKVRPDGTFSFLSDDGMLSSIDDPVASELSFEMDSNAGKGKTIVADDQGNVILLSRTNIFTLPNPDIYKSSLSRGKAARERFLEGVVDLCLVEYEGGTYYVAGPVGYGMQANLPKASRLYKVDVLKGRNVIDSLLTTMSVAFVKYNSFTVMPYPFKYLRENLARKGGK